MPDGATGAHLRAFGRMAMAIGGTLAFLAAGPAHAALTLQSAGAAVTQNFDTLGNSLSTSGLNGGGWRLSQANDVESFSVATSALASLQSGLLDASTLSFGNYNYGEGADRAIGFLLRSTTALNGPRSIILQMTNNTGQTLADLALSWDLEKYRTATANKDFTVSFFHGSDGATWTAATAGDHFYVGETSIVGLSPPTTVSKSLSLSGLSIAHGTSYYLRWTFGGVGGGGNTPGIGLDNFSATGFNATSVPEASPAVMGIVVVGLAALCRLVQIAPRRRRNLRAR
jgi:hypothetical protein